ncbi:deoxyribose-phosphate aldolase [Eisenibacter elegans]|jgi:deoxyribose-phosphate aldolase|uniref:deoxyribose-phosphate aldolase n=1 Tax=Eisenibacter elegans TaxID=997 RepID=UPI0004274CD8|nr:deoxyribose-phosphate aldolase [Eisenibacter elegans]
MIAQYLEHTLLSPTAAFAEMDKLVAEAIEHHFVGVCVPPFWVKKVKRDLRQHDIAVVTVVGFPLGYNRSEVKRYELQSCIRDGADELDVVMNVGAVKAGAYPWVKQEMAALAQEAHQHERLLKVILETAYLSPEEIVQSCKVCVEAGVDFIKTSTGYAPEGATLEGIRLIKESIPAGVGIKASGGIRTLAQAQAFIAAGAERIGTSAGVSIVAEAQQAGGGAV